MIENRVELDLYTVPHIAYLKTGTPNCDLSLLHISSEYQFAPEGSTFLWYISIVMLIAFAIVKKLFRRIQSAVMIVHEPGGIAKRRCENHATFALAV